MNSPRVDPSAGKDSPFHRRSRDRRTQNGEVAKKCFEREVALDNKDGPRRGQSQEKVPLHSFSSIAFSNSRTGLDSTWRPELKAGAGNARSKRAFSGFR